MTTVVEQMAKETRQCSSTRLGEIEYQDSQCYQCPEGLLGFDDEHEFVLMDDPKVTPFRWLQSTTTPELCLLLVESRLIRPEHQLKLSREALHISVEEQDLTEVHVIASLGASPQDTTLNFRGPLVLNRSQHIFQQVIDESGELKTPLMPS
jgi:flagellar assembly factor FliW